jgi:hypothetical protein
MNILWKSIYRKKRNKNMHINLHIYTYITYIINLKEAVTTKKIAVYKFIISSHEKQEYSKLGWLILTGYHEFVVIL